MQRSILLTAIAGAIAVAAVAVPTSLASSDRSGGREVHVVARLEGPDPLHGTPRCDPAGRCVMTVEGSAEVTGDLVGATANAGALMFNSATNSYLTMQYTMFTGTIDGCGAGSLLLRSPEVRGKQQPFIGTISVLLGTGTDGLRGVSGGGTYTVAKDGDVYVSEWTLDLRCPKG